MKNKKTFGIILMIVGVFFLTLGCIYLFIISPRMVFQKEMNKVSALDLMTDEVDLTVRSKGDYGKLEKTIKNYLSVSSKNMKDIVSILEDERITNVLSLENYRKDGKEFIQTKSYLEETRKKMNQSFENLIEMSDQDYIKKQIDPSLSKKYQDIYQEYMFGDGLAKEIEDLKKELTQTKKELDHTFSVYEETIQFLIDHKDQWNLDETSIIFEDLNLSNQYNEMIGKL